MASASRKPRKTTAHKRHSKVRVSKARLVAHRTRRNSPEAVIPVAFKSTRDAHTAAAVIPVEVNTTAGDTVKRAAVVPVTVRDSTKLRSRTSRRRSRALSHKDRPASNVENHDRSKMHEQQRDLLTRSVVTLAHAEESAVNMVGQLGLTILHVVPKITRAALGLPLDLSRKIESEVTYGDAAIEVDAIAA